MPLQPVLVTPACPIGKVELWWRIEAFGKVAPEVRFILHVLGWSYRTPLLVFCARPQMNSINTKSNSNLLAPIDAGQAVDRSSIGLRGWKTITSRMQTVQKGVVINKSSWPQASGWSGKDGVEMFLSVFSYPVLLNCFNGTASHQTLYMGFV